MTGSTAPRIEAPGDSSHCHENRRHEPRCGERGEHEVYEARECEAQAIKAPVPVLKRVYAKAKGTA